MIIYVFCFNLSEHTPRWKAVVAVACQHYTTLLRVHSLFVLKRYLKRGQTQMLLPLVSHRTCHFFKKLRGGEMVWKALFFENWLVQEWRKKISQYFFPSFWFIAHECRQCLSIWEILWSNKNKLPNTFLVRFWESLGNTTFPISGPGVQDQLFQPGPFFFGFKTSQVFVKGLYIPQLERGIWNLFSCCLSMTLTSRYRAILVEVLYMKQRMLVKLMLFPYCWSMVLIKIKQIEMVVSHLYMVQHDLDL